MQQPETPCQFSKKDDQFLVVSYLDCIQAKPEESSQRGLHRCCDDVVTNRTSNKILNRDWFSASLFVT